MFSGFELLISYALLQCRLDGWLLRAGKSGAMSAFPSRASSTVPASGGMAGSGPATAGGAERSTVLVVAPQGPSASPPNVVPQAGARRQLLRTRRRRGVASPLPF